jgi:uncharacterized protein
MQGSAPALPASAAWRLVGAHDGFEVLFPGEDDEGVHLDGHLTVVEEGVPCALRYSIRVDRSWTTQWAQVIARSGPDWHERQIQRTPSGALTVNGATMPELEGLVDVDLEGSAVTNALPVNRMKLEVGEGADAPAAYVRLPDLRVVRLDQTYRRIEDDGDRAHYEYEAPEFDTSCVLVYDEAGLVLDYPGIARRVL